MSAREAPTQLFQVGNIVVPLPAYARPDLSFLAAEALATVPAGIPAAVIAGGESLQIVVTAFAILTTSATAANRTAEAVFSDQDGAFVAVIPCASSIPANSTGFYTWDISIANAFWAAGNVFASPLPPIVLSPAWQFEITAVNLQAGDAFTSGYATQVMVPTGPPRESAPAPATFALA